MLFIPALMGLSYITLPSIKFTMARNYKDLDETDQSANEDSNNESNDENREPINRREETPKFNLDGLIKRIFSLKKLLKYMIPLFLVRNFFKNVSKMNFN